MGMTNNKKPNKVVNYFKDVKSELKKVVWPSFKQVKNNTLIVIACILIIGIFICVFVFIFDKSLGNIITRVQDSKKTEQTTDKQTDESSSLSQEETEQALKNYLAQYGITYENNVYKDKDGKELTQEEVSSIISASQNTTEDEKKSEQ